MKILYATLNQKCINTCLVCNGIPPIVVVVSTRFEPWTSATLNALSYDDGRVDPNYGNVNNSVSFTRNDFGSTVLYNTMQAI